MEATPIIEFLIYARYPDSSDPPNALVENVCAIRNINQWYDQGHFICFFTARTEDHRDGTLAWLEKHGVKYHRLILGKPRRREEDEYHYIDDTPIRATRYKGVFADMVKKTKDVMVFEDE